MKRIFVILLLAFAAGAWAVGTGSSGTSGSTSGPAKSPQTAEQWFDAGYALADRKDYRGGADAFRKAIGLDAQYAEAYNMLGFCLRNLGQLDQAFAAYEKALTLDPAFPEAREYYGEAWLMRGNVAKAEEQYKILSDMGSREASELREKIDDYRKKHP